MNYRARGGIAGRELKDLAAGCERWSGKGQERKKKEKEEKTVEFSVVVILGRVMACGQDLDVAAVTISPAGPDSVC